MTKPTKPTVPPAPSRANPGPVFSQTADTFAAFQAPFADYLDALAEFVDDRADEALAAAIGSTLPPLTGRALNMTRANAGGTALEFRTPAQVRADLSINGIGSETAPTITNLNTLAVAGEYFANPGATGAPNGTDDFSVKHYIAGSTFFAFQEAFSMSVGRRWFRAKSSGAWGGWQEIPGTGGITAAMLVAAVTPIGVGQVWANQSRALATNYTNTTGRPIQISVRLGLVSSSGTGNATLTIAGLDVGIVTLGESNGSSWNGMANTLTAIVPAGAVYAITGTNASMLSWSELR
jgi:hypothetical protein